MRVSMDIHGYYHMTPSTERKKQYYWDYVELCEDNAKMSLEEFTKMSLMDCRRVLQAARVAWQNRRAAALQERILILNR